MAREDLPQEVRDNSQNYYRNPAGQIKERGSDRVVYDPGGGDGGGDGGGGISAEDSRRQAEEAASRAAAEARAEFARRQQEMLERQRREEDEAIGGFQRRLEGLERPEDIFSRFEEERGVGDIRERTKAIRQRASDLEQQLGQLPDDVTQRLEGTMSTEAQRRRLLAKEQQPLVGGLQDTTRELGVESGNLADAMQGVAQMTELAIRGDERELEPARMRIAAMSDRAARELAAFTSEREMELDALMDKLNRTRQLSDIEAQRAFQLSQQERAYEQTLQQLEEQARLTEEQNQRQREFTAGESALDRMLNRELTGLKESGATARTNISSAPKSTQRERQVSALSGLQQGVFDVFRQNTGDDGFVDPRKYQEERQRLIAKGVDPEVFDESFASYLSPEERARMGIGRTTNAFRSEGGGGDPFGVY